MSAPRLYLNHDADYDWLIAVEFGRIDEGQGSDAWHAVNDRFGVLRDRDGRAIGFAVKGFSTFDPEAADVAEIWEPPLFDAPVLGLHAASAGEIVLAARTLFGGRSSVNRDLFDAATAAQDEEALPLWLACLQAGDSMAHFGLGYTLYDLGRHQEAYRHLRYYTEIAPELAWGWCWFGKAAGAIGEAAEARDAFRRAIALEEAGGDETDARALLAALDGGEAALVTGTLDLSAFMRDTVTAWGALVERGPSFLERLLVRAFCAAAEQAAPVVASGRVALAIPGWDPQPGETDIVVTLPDGGGRVLAEAKVDDIDQMLWDIFKMASASRIDGVRAVYLLGAAPPVRSPGLRSARWAGSRACAELFDPENGGRVWESADMLRVWDAAWTALLKGGRGRPARVPAQVRVEFVGSSPVPAFPGYEARCIEVRVEGDQWLELQGGRIVERP